MNFPVHVGPALEPKFALEAILSHEVHLRLPHSNCTDPLQFSKPSTRATGEIVMFTSKAEHT